ESLVWDNKSPKCAAKLMASKHILRLARSLQEVVVCVQRFVAPNIKKGPMVLVASALGDNADLRPRIAAHLGAGNAGLHVELLNRVRNVEISKRAIHLRIVVVDAVKREVVRLCTHT